MKDLSRRLIVSSVFIACLAFLIYFAFHPLFQYFVALIVAGLAGIAIWEYSQLAIEKGGRILLPVLTAAAFILAFSFFCAIQFYELKGLPAWVLLFSIFILFGLHFKESEGAIVDLAISSFGLLYIAIPMGMVLGILYFSGGEDGRWWVIYLLSVTKISDIGAYFGGNLWGKHKLAPAISPGKTIEGAIAGLICAILASYGFHALREGGLLESFHLGAFEAIALGTLLGVVGQFGDLSESLLKRDAKKKDSNTLPGLGGALDFVDSLLFNAAIVYLYLNYFKM